MNCKNCGENIANGKKYCSNCGAKIISNRITAKGLWANFIVDFFGWDNKYLTTLKDLIIRPEEVLDGYINGVRKKYVTPFIFLAIATAFAMLVFNQYSDKYIQLTTLLHEQQMELIQGKLDSSKKIENFKEYSEKSKEENIEAQKSILKYYNISTFLLIPFYALIAFWVFGKPHNYGEHLVINCYIQGVTFLLSIVIFLLSIFTNPYVFFLAILASISYYLYAYKRLNSYSFSGSMLKLLKFIGIMLIVPILLFLAGLTIGFLSSKFG